MHRYFEIIAADGERLYVGRNRPTKLTAKDVAAYANKIGALAWRVVDPNIVRTGSPEDRAIDRRATFASRF